MKIFVGQGSCGIASGAKKTAVRINEILKEMLTKGISGAPYRIYTWDNAAYGSGESLFYGDLFLYIPAFLSYVYFKVSAAYKIFIFAVKQMIKMGR